MLAARQARLSGHVSVGMAPGIASVLGLPFIKAMDESYIDLDVTVVLEAARCQRASLKKSPFTADEFLNCLLRQQLPETVLRLRPLAALI